MASRSRNIRVGIIRCDLHAMYYGALMCKHDPFLLRDPFGPGRKLKGKYSWETGGAHFYFYTNYGNAAQIMVPTVEGFDIVKVWDEDKDTAAAFSTIFDTKPEVCDKFEQVSDDVDLVFIADCNGDGSDHLKLGTPSLKKGVPTFLDKPFAYTVKDAKALIRIANQHGTPMMSSSILRQLPQATLFRDRFQELGDVEFGTVKGGGIAMAGHIHAISLAQHLFGDGVEAVEVMGQTPLAHMFLDYGGKPGRPTKGVALNCDAGLSPHCAMYASAYSAKGVVHSPEFGDWIFPEGAAKILRMIKTMVKTGKPQIAHESILELIAIAEAARKSQATGKRVSLKEAL